MMRSFDQRRKPVVDHPWAVVRRKWHFTCSKLDHHGDARPKSVKFSKSKIKDIYSLCNNPDMPSLEEKRDSDEGNTMRM
jgi:hypothetical protein